MTLRWNEFKQSAASFGWWPTARDLLLRVANRLLPCRLLEVILLERLEPGFQVKTTNGLRVGLIALPQILPFDRSSEYVWPDQGLKEAGANGDRCYGVFDVAANRPAATGWYAVSRTVNDGCVVNVKLEYVYMHCGFTHADYRGQRLHAAGMVAALEAYQAEGFRGIICEVDSRNLASLKSCYRMGWRRVGYLLVLWPDKPGRVNLHSAGCRKVGLHMGAREKKAMHATASA